MIHIRDFTWGFGSAMVLLAWAAQDSAPRQVSPAPDSRTSAWGEAGAADAFAKNLRLRLDDLAGMQGLELVCGWSMLMREFGLVYDGHMLGHKDDWAPCRFGWHVDCSAIGDPAWTIRNDGITQEDVDRGRIESEVVEVPKQAAVRFITENGVSESMPSPSELAQSVLFISFGAKATLVDMRNGNHYRIPFDQPSPTLLDRSPASLFFTKFGEAALAPSPFWD
jgi:hypothetical protein